MNTEKEKNMNTKKLLNWITLVTLLTLVLSACGTKKETPVTTPMVATPVVATPVVDATGEPLTGSLAAIKERGVIKIGVSLYVPSVIQAPDGSFSGFEIDLLNKLANQIGVTVEYIPVGFDILAAGLQTGKYDMTTAMLVSDERKQIVDFSTVSVAVLGQVWMVLTDNPKNFQTIEDLNKPEVKIVVTTGAFDETVTTKYIPKATQKSVPGIQIAQLVTEVISGQVDACTLETPVNTGLYKEQYGDLIKFIPDALHPVEVIGTNWAVPKGDTVLQTYISKFLQEQFDNGYMEELNAKYMTKKYLVP
jgi:polar amino acid transport system substrate-binding protein